MSGKNVVQKILARAAGRESVETGEYLIVRSNCPTPMQGQSLGRGNDQIQQMGAKLFDPTKVRVVMGVVGGSKSVGDARRRVHRWAEEMGVPRENFVELGHQGVPHVVSGERVWPLPGEVYFSMNDGHSSSLGALGAFAVTLSYETGAYLAKGTTWIQVPEVVRFTLTGEPPRGVYSRDVYEYVLGQIGDTGTTGQVIHWDGDYVSSLDMDDRFTLCTNALFSSAWTNLIEPDSVTLDYVRARTKEAFSPLYSDPDAEYEEQRTFDISKLEPQVVPPPRRASAVPIAQHQGKPITTGFVGSCANGRLGDLQLAAQVLKGRKVHPHVTLNITAGSTEVYLKALKQGWIQAFIEAGVLLPTPNCGMCASGTNSPLGAGDVCVSSGTCNYPGRMGSDKAEIYLASPATVAASAVAGCITDPREFL